MGKIVQIIDSFHDEQLSFRICEVVGTYNNPFTPSRLVVGSNRFLSWEFDEWLPEYNKEFTDIESSPLRYGRVLVAGDKYEITKYRIWIK